MCATEQVKELADRLNKRSRQVTIDDIATSTGLNKHWLHKLCGYRLTDIRLSWYNTLQDYAKANNL